MVSHPLTADIVIVGAGAAGLAAAIFAGETAENKNLKIILIDGAKKPGAKILVSGGGRCNVTNVKVTPNDYWGGSPTIIRNILRSFDEERTRAWMASLGVELKLEPTGKYFPTTDSSRTVLDALLHRVEELGVKLYAGTRVTGIARNEDGFSLKAGENLLAGRRVVLATGGLALPKSGSDGLGVEMARAMGHEIVAMTPALAPMIAHGAALEMCKALSGVTFDARVRLRTASGKITYDRVDSLLFTHFGISGPAALNVSRHWLRMAKELAVELTIGAPQFQDSSEADRWLLKRAGENPKRLAATVLSEIFPERYASLLAEGAGEISKLTRDQRRRLAEKISGHVLELGGSRGYSFAETTAGGVGLGEMNWRTMESSRVEGLYFCGEMLDVDGRIGGFNFQWAWASGFLAGRAAAALDS